MAGFRKILCIGRPMRAKKKSGARARHRPCAVITLACATTCPHYSAPCCNSSPDITETSY